MTKGQTIRFVEATDLLVDKDEVTARLFRNGVAVKAFAFSYKVEKIEGYWRLMHWKLPDVTPGAYHLVFSIKASCGDYALFERRFEVPDKPTTEKQPKASKTKR